MKTQLNFNISKDEMIKWIIDLSKKNEYYEFENTNKEVTIRLLETQINSLKFQLKGQSKRIQLLEKERNNLKNLIKELGD